MRSLERFPLEWKANESILAMKGIGSDFALNANRLLTFDMRKIEIEIEIEI